MNENGWNKWGWFGGVIGSSLWMYLLAAEMLWSGQTYLHPIIGFNIALCVTALGILLWRWRTNLSVSQAMRLFVLALFPATLCLLVLRSTSELGILHQYYWSMLFAFSFLFVQFAYVGNYGPFAKKRELLCKFTDEPLDKDARCENQMIAIQQTQQHKKTFSLFHYDCATSLADSMIIYEAYIKSENVEEAYLEMWAVFDNGQKYFSRGVNSPIRGTQDWQRFSIPFFLSRKQSPSAIELNIVISGIGNIYIKDIALHCRRALRS
ncbi:hypothetical protein [Candidatus Uabimicrobium amorphum]|uniref:Uncharacterized protein n=1 Tax=Uabimicrobium amorphum TaxID=2596890 RepID=A0A5S9F4S3_UABAM|nr:hypothetical protein [Candidatus Uabimicrobium amorphum]BBM86107.1 hypothetical protein UABAM_04493 [Candidatus Uabimicrobium amorphum]